MGLAGRLPEAAAGSPARSAPVAAGPRRRDLAPLSAPPGAAAVEPRHRWPALPRRSPARRHGEPLPLGLPLRRRGSPGPSPRGRVRLPGDAVEDVPAPLLPGRGPRRFPGGPRAVPRGKRCPVNAPLWGGQGFPPQSSRLWELFGLRVVSA